MLRVIVIVGLAVRFLAAIAAAESTCLSYVKYVGGKRNRRIEAAIIEIPSAPIGVDLQLRVEMAVPFALPPRYFLNLGLAQSEADSIRAIHEGKPLRYRINIPPGRAAPAVYSLSFNNQKLCEEIPAIGRTMTTIDLEHTIPSLASQLASDGGKVTKPEVPTPTPTVDTQPTLQYPTLRYPTPTAVTQPTPTPTVVTQPTPTPAVAPSVEPGPIDNQECGRSGNVKTVNQLVVRGIQISPGQFPWLVAIFFTSRSRFEFQCAGTLVTNTHVITAAHCFEDDKGLVLANLFHVSLGRYRLRNWRERGSVNVNLNKYTVHPDYKPGMSNADADLAIAVLRDSVQFTPLIQPACLWSGSLELSEVIGLTGYVVGWGEDEYGNAYVEEPRMSRQPIVSQEDCLWSHPVFSTARSRRTFCAGARDGSGPCNGDSGSGLVLQDPLTGRFHLRGVVSLSLRDAVSTRCDLAQYVVYVDIAMHLEWLRRQIAA